MIRADVLSEKLKYQPRSQRLPKDRLFGSANSFEKWRGAFPARPKDINRMIPLQGGPIFGAVINCAEANYK
jgi:hypothetical protein